MIESGDSVVHRNPEVALGGTVEERRVRLLVRSPDGDARWYDEQIVELVAEEEGPIVSDVKVPHAEVGDKVRDAGGFEGILTRIQSVTGSSGRGNRIGWVVAEREEGEEDSESKWLFMEDLKKVDLPRKLLPDMDQIDEAVLVWKRLGLKITAIVDDIREKGGLTITVKPEGPIEINLSGLTIHIPAN